MITTDYSMHYRAMSFHCCWMLFSALSLLVGQQEEHLAHKKLEWWGATMVICLERGANDLHMVQLMPLPPHHLCFSKIQNRIVYPSGTSLPGLSCKEGHWTTVVVCWMLSLSIITWCSDALFALNYETWMTSKCMFSCDLAPCALRGHK